MDIFRMKCFISVAHNQSMTAAAREMFITRPAMTAQMNGLEGEMGCQLLIRDRKKIQLTPAGRRTLQTFEDVVVQLDALAQDARRIQADLRGKLHIGFHGPTEWMHTYDFWRSFSDDNPGVDVELVMDPWDRLVKSVVGGNLDIAFVELSEIDESMGLASRQLFDELICVVVRRDHPFAKQDIVTMDQLRDQHLLLPDFKVSPRFFRSLQQGFRNAGITIHEMGQGNYSEATIALAASGMGITMMPRSFCMPSNAVAYVDLDAPEIPVHMGIVWREGNDNPALPAFIDAASAWEWKA
jgi:DNA-binding transcriptional LysR family regulator